MRDFFGEVMVPLGICALFLALCMGGIFLMLATFNRIECSNLADISGKQTMWRWFGGCYVQHEGEMLPYDKWIQLDVRVKSK